MTMQKSKKIGILSSALGDMMEFHHLPEDSYSKTLIIFFVAAVLSQGRLSAALWQEASTVFHTVFKPDLDDLSGYTSREHAEHQFLILQTYFYQMLQKEDICGGKKCVCTEDLSKAFLSLPEDKAAVYLAFIHRVASEYAQVLDGLENTTTAAQSRGAELMQRGTNSIPGVRAWRELFGAEDDNDLHHIIMDTGLARLRKPMQSSASSAWRQYLGFTSSKVANAGAMMTHVAEKAVNKALIQCGGWSSYFKELHQHRSFIPPLQKEYFFAEPFRILSDKVEALECAAERIGGLESIKNAADMRRMMISQPFTVVVVGEGKRGKSSLINALLSQELSPVRESVPATAATARFYWGDTFRATIRFLTDQDCLHLDQFIQQRSDSDMFLHRLETLTHQSSSSKIQELENPEQLRQFLSSDSQNSLFAARAEVEVPSDILRQGMTLVDTPGLNALDPIQNYLAYEECLTADCLIFVMDARRPDSASERELIRLLASAGRATRIIGVLTGSDKLNEVTSRKDAFDRAKLLMDEARSLGMECLTLLDINAREAMERCCSAHSKKSLPALDTLIQYIASAAEQTVTDRKNMWLRVHQKGLELAAVARSEAKSFYESELALLPDVPHQDMLRKHIERMESAIQSCTSQTWAVVQSVDVDMEVWKKEQERALDSWQERTLLRIMDAAHKHADTLGLTGMFRPRNWKDFDEKEAPRIARECLEELLQNRRDLQQDWTEKLRQFGKRMQEISVLCLDAVTTGEAELRSLGEVPFRQERWLVNANSLMKKLGLVAVGLALRRGGGVGLGIVLGNMGWWAVLPAAIAGSLIWSVMKFGNPSRCRRILLDRKEASVKKWLAAQRSRLDVLLEQNLQELTSAYSNAVQDGFVPALGILAEESFALRAYLGVLERIQNCAFHEASILMEQAEQMEKILIQNKTLTE